MRFCVVRPDGSRRTWRSHELARRRECLRRSRAAVGAGVCCANAGEAATQAARMSATLTMTPSFSTRSAVLARRDVEGEARSRGCRGTSCVPPVNAAAIPAAPSGLFREVASPNCRVLAVAGTHEAVERGGHAGCEHRAARVDERLARGHAEPSVASARLPRRPARRLSRRPPANAVVESESARAHATTVRMIVMMCVSFTSEL